MTRQLQAFRRRVADITYARYVGPSGSGGLHRVRPVGSESTIIVGSSLHGTTFAPGAVVPLGSNTGRPGRFILGAPPPEHSGGSRAPVEVGSETVAALGITAVAPDEAPRGTTTEVVVAGYGFGATDIWDAVVFDAGSATLHSSDPAVTSVTATVDGPTQVTLDVAVAAAAPVGHLIDIGVSRSATQLPVVAQDAVRVVASSSTESTALILSGGNILAVRYIGGEAQGLVASKSNTVGATLSDLKLSSPIGSDPLGTVGDNSVAFRRGGLNLLVVWDVVGDTFHTHATAGTPAGPVWADGWLWWLERSGSSHELRKARANFTTDGSTPGSVLVSTLGVFLGSSRIWVTDDDVQSVTTTGDMAYWPRDGSSPDAGVGRTALGAASSGHAHPLPDGRACRFYEIAVDPTNGSLAAVGPGGSDATEEVIWPAAWTELANAANAYPTGNGTVLAFPVVDGAGGPALLEAEPRDDIAGDPPVVAVELWDGDLPIVLLPRT